MLDGSFTPFSRATDSETYTTLPQTWTIGMFANVTTLSGNDDGSVYAFPSSGGSIVEELTQTNDQGSWGITGSILS
jgi:hypothetical protein